MSKRGRPNGQSTASDEEINVFLMIKRTIAMKVKRTGTIKNLKTMIHEKEGISEDIQDLFFGGNRLTNGSLIDYGIERDSTLHLIPRNHIGLKLFVKLPTNETPIVVEAMAHHSVRKIKTLIQAKEGVDSDRFNLIFDGNILEDDRTLSSLNITSESKLQLVFCPSEVVSISVKAPTGDIVKLKVQVLLTVNDVKEIVGNMTRVCISDQILSLEGKLLEDCNTLAFYNIKEESMLVMISPSSIQIFVKTPTQEIVKLNVKVWLTVRVVKAIVANMTNGSVVGHDLWYGGMKLEDLKTLSCYDIKNDFLLELLTPQFQIFVSIWGGKTVTLDVRECNTIRDVQDKLSHKLQIPPGIECIVFDLKNLEHNKDLAIYYNIQKHSTLSSYNIQKNSTLSVLLFGSRKVPLNSIDPSISLNTSICDVKKMVTAKFEAPVRKLLIKKVALRDNRILASYVEDLSEEVDVVF